MGGVPLWPFVGCERAYLGRPQLVPGVALTLPWSPCHRLLSLLALFLLGSTPDLQQLEV